MYRNEAGDCNWVYDYDNLMWKCEKQNCDWVFNESNCQWNCVFREACDYTCEDIKQIDDRVKVVEDILFIDTNLGSSGGSKLIDQLDEYVTELEGDINYLYKWLDVALNEIDQLANAT
jgi:hypothetical protein